MRYPVILLAAGRSKRIGSPKGLVEFNGKYWILNQVERLLGVKEISRVIVVLGFHAKAYREALRPLRGKVVFVRNPKPSRGQFSSIQAGFSALLPEDKGCFLLPLDVPVADAALWRALPKLASATASMPDYEGCGGHPVFLKKTYINALQKIRPTDASARLDVQLHLLKPNQLKRVKSHDPKVIFNLNHLEQFRVIEKSV